MENQYTAESLKEEIKALEIKQAEEGKLLKKQLLITYENFKPINILKNIVRDFSSSDNYKQDFLEIVAGMTSGFITKKIVVGRSKNPMLKLIGLAIQFGITTVVSKKYQAIKESVIQFVNHFLEGREQKKDVADESSAQN
ncbi:MAG TPA: hypothetical protein VLQ91_09445 [Draconibacterium sp.]|jgi:hypothetical protein|nr:hypothetical protein [Draconibacterium sp.]